MHPSNDLKDAVGCSRASWWLWMVHLTNFDMVFLWYDIPFSVDNLRANCLPPKNEGSFRYLDGLFQGHKKALNGSIYLLWCYLAKIWHSSHNWQLPSCAQNFFPRYMRDPPYIFKDAVNGLFQGATTTLNGWIDTPWLCIVLRWLSFHSWQLPILAKPVFPFRHL